MVLNEISSQSKGIPPIYLDKIAWQHLEINEKIYFFLGLLAIKIGKYDIYVEQGIFQTETGKEKS